MNVEIIKEVSFYSLNYIRHKHNNILNVTSTKYSVLIKEKFFIKKSNPKALTSKVSLTATWLNPQVVNLYIKSQSWFQERKRTLSGVHNIGNQVCIRKPKLHGSIKKSSLKIIANIKKIYATVFRLVNAIKTNCKQYLIV